MGRSCNFLLLFSFYSFLLLFCLRAPSMTRYSVKYWDWPPYCWQPHKFCNILCFVREVLWVICTVSLRALESCFRVLKSSFRVQKLYFRVLKSSFRALKLCFEVRKSSFRVLKLCSGCRNYISECWNQVSEYWN